MWTASTGSHGYGDLWVDGKHWLAHRYALGVIAGVDIEGAVVCHRCDVHACVNPRHLFVGTQRDNMRDASEKGRTVRGERSNFARLTADDVREIRRLCAAGTYQKDVAAMFGIDQSNVSKIVNRRSWGHV